MAKAKLTIGMAVHDDFHGVYFTSQSLRMFHAADMHDVEIVVVDNSPDTEHGRQTKRLVEAWLHVGTAGARYIPMPEPVGTSAPRNRVFAEASGDYVACVDSHVLFWPDSIRRLKAYFDAHPDTGDLLQGPLVYDDLRSIATHFADEWRGQMWGTWATDPRGIDLDGEPFEIPGQGLGLFACRRDKWLGFNEHFRGFGGEEMYVHEKFRKAGHRTLCLPFLRWLHRFGRPDGVRYNLTLWSKVRNYVIGHQEIGLPLDRVHEHFVSSGLMRESEWNALIADPIGNEKPVILANSSTCGGGRSQPEREPQGLDELFAWVKSHPRDLDQHAERIRALASEAEHVTAFVKRREWNAILAAGRPKTLVVYQSESDDFLGKVHEAVKLEQGKSPMTYTTHVGADPLAANPIAQTDLLVIDTTHHAERLWSELTRHGHRVRERILLRGTGAYGERSEDGKGPGLLPAARRWMREHPEWSVVWHTAEQYGMTLLSRLPSDRPPLPGKLAMAGNLARALASHVADGLTKTSPEELESRLLECSICPSRSEDRCSVCGCFLAPKAAMRSAECPLGKWSTISIPSETEPENGEKGERS